MQFLSPEIKSTFFRVWMALLIFGITLASPRQARAADNDFQTLGTKLTVDFACTNPTCSQLPDGWVNDASMTRVLDDGTGTTAKFYYYGIDANDTNRALGMIPDQAGRRFGAEYVNKTGQRIARLRIQFKGQMWHVGSNSASWAMAFDYSTTATSPNDPDPAKWTRVSALEYQAERGGLSEGVNPNPRPGVTIPTANPPFTISGLDIPNNGSVFIRWISLGGGANEYGLAIDDFEITPLGQIRLSLVSPGTVPEGTVANFVVNLSEAPPAPITVNAGTIDGTARKVDGDYTDGFTSPVTINSTTTTLPVTISADGVVEPAETFSMEITQLPLGYCVADTPASSSCSSPVKDKASALATIAVNGNPLLITGPDTVETTATANPTPTIYTPSGGSLSGYVFSAVNPGGGPPPGVTFGLPPGVNFSAAGALTGSPQQPGVYRFIVTLNDSAMNPPGMKTVNYTVNAVPSVTTTSAQLSVGKVGVTYNETLARTGGTAPFTWTIVPPNGLPGGLNLSGNMITGSPTVGGVFNFGVRVTDAAGIPSPVKDLSIEVLAKITISTSPATLAFTVDGQPKTGTASFDWNVGSTHTIAVSPDPQLDPGGSQNPAVATKRYRFRQWSDNGGVSHGITVAANVTNYTADFRTQYKVVTKVSPLLSATIAAVATNPDPSTISQFNNPPPSADGNGFYDEGSLITLTATPATSDFNFARWNGEPDPVKANQNPLVITLASPRIIEGIFSVNNIITTNLPAGGPLAVTVDGAPCTTPCSKFWEVGERHVVVFDTPQTIASDAAGKRYRFSAWADGEAADLVGGTPKRITRNIDVVKPTTWVANFATQYFLSTSVFPAPGATISASPLTNSIYVSDTVASNGTGWYDIGTVVTLTPNFNTGFSLGTWTGTTNGSTGTNPIVFPMTQTRSVQLNLLVAITIGSNLYTTPTNLQVVVDGATISTPKTYNWVPGDPHVVSAVAPQPFALKTRYGYLSWTDGGAFSHSITTPQAPALYSANYQFQHLLTLIVTPAAGGTAFAIPPAADGFYNQGAIVAVTYEGNTSYRFFGYIGALYGLATPQNVTMDTPKEVTAQFENYPPCAITFSRQATASLPSGALDRVEVQTGPNCPWTASSDSNWITILSSVTGTTTGTLRYQIAPNPSAQPRSGRISVNGTPFPIFQSSSTCSNIAVTPASQSANAAPSALQATVSAPAVCNWVPVSEASWLRLAADGTTRSANAVLSYSTLSGSDILPRIGAINAGGQVIPVLQKPVHLPQFFLDVQPNNIFADYIALLALGKVAAPCSSTQYCPDANLTRAEMAEQIIRALFGEASFPYTTTPFFPDVNAQHPQFRFIQKMRDLGITNGCDANRYCPGDASNRGQMAAFLTRARLGVAPNAPFPYAPDAFFGDVSTANIFFGAIQKIRELGITTGCTATTFCPNDPVTRGQMAAFVARGLLVR